MALSNQSATTVGNFRTKSSGTRIIDVSPTDDGPISLEFALLTTCTIMRRDLAALEKPTVPYPFPSVPKGLNHDASKVAFSIRKVLDDIIVRALKSRTLEDFRLTRNHSFREFCIFVRALSELVRTNTDPCTGGKLALEEMRSDECEFRASAPRVIGSNATNEALFHLVTLRKTFELVHAIVARELDSELDRAAARQCMNATLWVGFHYECALALARKQISVSKEVLQELLASLAVVDLAYVAARQGYQLRYPEKQLHKFQATQPSANMAFGDVEKIFADSLQEHEAWAPSRDSANKQTIPQ